MDQTTLTQQVYDRLHARLRAGELGPGTRLVNRTLAAELGTSTIPVREALNRLASEGLLELTPGAGAFVRSPDLDELAELYDVREALESLAAAEAARFAAPHLLAELRAIAGALRQVADSLPEDGSPTAEQFATWLECEERFHTRIAAASRNRRLVKLIADLRVIAQVFAAQRPVPALLTRAGAEATLRQHEAFLEILAERNAERAREWMSAHIRHGRDSVLGRLAAERTGR